MKAIDGNAKETVGNLGKIGGNSRELVETRSSKLVISRRSVETKRVKDQRKHKKIN